MTLDGRDPVAECYPGPWTELTFWAMPRRGWCQQLGDASTAGELVRQCAGAVRKWPALTADLGSSLNGWTEGAKGRHPTAQVSGLGDGEVRSTRCLANSSRVKHSRG